MNILPSKQDYRGNILSQLLYFWIEKLFKKGFKSTLKQGDLLPCPKEQCSEYLYDNFEEYWQFELAKREGTDIKKALAKSLKFQFIIGGIFLFAESILSLLQAVLVSQFTSSLSNDSATTSIVYTIVISIAILVTMFARTLGNYYLYCSGIQLRTVCTTALFKKCMKLQQATLYRVSVGHIINLVSNDVYKLEFGVCYWNYLWISPITVILTIIITLVYIGPIGLFGVAYIVLHMPLQICIGFIFGHFRYLQSITTDKRIKLMDQILRGIRVIKFYAWENSFSQYISGIRKNEMRYASLAGFTQSLTFSLFNTCLFIALLLISSISIALDNQLSTSQLALAFLLFIKLRIDCVLYFGHAVLTGRESVVALRRIQNILLLPENVDNCLTKSPSSGVNPSFEITNFSASWGGTDGIHRDNLVLHEINLSVVGAQLVVLAGPIGAGKSSLLLSLNNELPGMTGLIHIKGISSYAAQQPWIFSGTFQANILFGNPLNAQRYQQVIAACGLTADISDFEEGDLTLIGERGVTLSGGQKARVSLARAVYQEADIYLLDDPLSAVDMKVGREIFENCVKRFLRDKIVVMVTHHTQYVKSADAIIVMREGSVVCKGDYETVVMNDFCKEFLFDLEKIAEREFSALRKLECDEFISLRLPTLDTATDIETNKPLSQALTVEDYAPHASSLPTYFHYFWTGGLFATVLMILFSLLSNPTLFLGYWWIQSIADCFDKLDMFTANASIVNQSSYCPWYFQARYPSAIGFAIIFTIFGSISTFSLALLFYYIVITASRRLHNRMLHRVLHCPVYFFDTNPCGRILNRFSKDVGFLDEQLPFMFSYFWFYGAYIVTVTIVSCLIQYILLVPVAVSLLLTLLLRLYYLRTSPQVKRLEGVARSPVYAHISLSLLGLSTIRALRIEKRVIQDYHYFQDEHTRAWFHYAICCRWFETRLDLLSCLLGIVGVIIAVISRYLFGFDQLVAFSLPLLLSIPFSFQFLIRLSGDVEILMVSADRILKYCYLIQENYLPPSTPSQSPPLASSLPKGELEFRDLFIRYSEDLPYSLVNISLYVQAGEKIGIIGRTGAGKSSLFNALCRMNEICEGSILIDREDISKLNLFEHRRRLSVIPQDPVLFSGTLRYNLDPFDEFSNDEIWEAVGNCRLTQMVQSLPNQLTSLVEEDGHNFSVGERQLLCLARAILRKEQNNTHR